MSSSFAGAVGLDYEEKVARVGGEFLRSDERVFYKLWARQFKKLELSLVHSVEAPTNSVNVNRRGISCSYTRASKKGNKNSSAPHIVFDNEHQYDLADVAILDSANPQRAFVGKTAENVLVGAICYFDGDKMDRHSMIAFSQVVFYEGNARCTWKNLFLCGDSLRYVWPYDDTPQVRLEGWLLQEDALHMKYSEEVSKRRYGDADIKVVGGRWLCFQSNTTTSYTTISFNDRLSVPLPSRHTQNLLPTSFCRHLQLNATQMTFFCFFVVGFLLCRMCTQINDVDASVVGI